MVQGAARYHDILTYESTVIHRLSQHSSRDNTKVKFSIGGPTS